MRNAMFFPNRILYREELLSTTVTYAVDLSEAEFWTLKPIMPIEELGIRPGTGAGDDRLSQGQQMVLDASTAERIQVGCGFLSGRGFWRDACCYTRI